MRNAKFFAITILTIVLCDIVCCERLTSKIYVNLQADNFCFRQLNATHQIGCTSSVTGNVGVVHVVETSRDIKWILQDGPDHPYIAALYFNFFNLANMTELKNSERVIGVLVLQGNVTVMEEMYSPERACPNEDFGLYGLYDKDHPELASCAQSEWNPQNPARTMLFQDWGMPIFLLTRDNDIQNVVEGCYKQFNAPVNESARPWPLCSAELGSYMLAAKDSPTCIRRNSMNPIMLSPQKLCDPLGSWNVMTTLFSTKKEEPLSNRSVIVIAAHLDSASMFDGIAPGADSAVTGLVTLLSVAHTLFQVKQKLAESKKNVLFAIFNGESFDYIGSSRTVYDMEKERFPQELQDGHQQPALIKLQNILHFIELSQVGPQKGSMGYWVHTDPISTSDSNVNKSVNSIVNTLKKYLKSSILRRTDPSHALPPASVQRFLRKDLNISSVVITNFDKQFTNKHYNSRFDLEDDLSKDWADYLKDLSTGVSKTVFKLLSGTEPDQNMTADSSMIKKIMECYLTNSYCELFQIIASPSKVKQRIFNRTEPYPLYVSVYSQGSVNPITIYTRYLLSYLTGEKVEGYTESNCTTNSTDQVFQYDWMVGNLSNPGMCIKSTVGFTWAISPAAELGDWSSTEYSTWTESVWHATTLRIFLRPSRQLEGLILGIGCLIFALSLVVVYSANKRADLLFRSRGLFGC